MNAHQRHLLQKLLMIAEAMRAIDISVGTPTTELDRTIRQTKVELLRKETAV